MESFRLPLQEAEESRDISTGKDGFSSNIIYDNNKNGTIFATKRPGLTAFASALGVGQGIYNYEDTIYSFNGTPYRWDTGQWVESSEHPNFLQYLVVGRPPHIYPTNLPEPEPFFYTLSSDDGYEWSVQRVTGGLPYNNSYFSDSVIHQGTFVAVSTSIYNTIPKAAFITSDGTAWQRADMELETGLGNASKSASLLASNGTTIVAAPFATTQTVQTSPTGLIWTMRTAFTLQMQVSALVASPSLFVVLPGGSTGSLNLGDIFYTSPDGISWTERTLPWIRIWNAATYNPIAGRFVAVNGQALEGGEEAMIIYSDDGITWQQATYDSLPVYRGWTDVVWTGSVFVASFYTPALPNAQGGYSVSEDGITWTDYFFENPKNVLSLVQLMTKGNNTVMYSTSNLKQARVLNEEATDGAFYEVPALYNPLDPGVY